MEEYIYIFCLLVMHFLQMLKILDLPPQHEGQLLSAAVLAHAAYAAEPLIMHFLQGICAMP